MRFFQRFLGNRRCATFYEQTDGDEIHVRNGVLESVGNCGACFYGDITGAFHLYPSNESDVSQCADWFVCLGEDTLYFLDNLQYCWQREAISETL